ncbi:oligosaccharide flippase family protein [Hymenobacter sp. 5516J-16]|uniref:oligosaccharide flippase family protein n=1 Tax=Hymenobacter sp. 5516J-16 TaxID=2932253 RepID=UPI001FD5E5F8|nr:oligosaccharide flippase family protein [Hymenobacter sp. 5516J-16]UOQ76610.1 oligosaccharide flippase family protein [Hymenobacter sp. 5516J-16]
MASSASNLTTAAVNGVKWSTAATITISLLQIGYTATMARLLTPAAFGLVALAGVILRFGSYFAQMGMEQAIIQKPEITRADVRAAFTSSLGLGILFAGALALGAPLAAGIVRAPEVVPVVRMLAVGLLLTGFNATALSLLRRRMKFRTLAIIEVTSYVVSYAALGIGLAFQGFGVWSLVAAMLGQGVLLTILSYAAERHDLRLLFDWETYRPLVEYGGRMSAISFLEFLTGSLDTLLIGRLLGAAALGIYSRGWMLIGLPVYLLTTSVSKVVFPSFSQMQTDRPRLKTVYLSSITLIAALVIPICAGAAIAAPRLCK